MSRYPYSAQRKLNGFTLIELLVVVAIIALLISILLPSLSNARKQAQAVACRAQLGQVMLALRMYQDDHQGWLPQAYNPEAPSGVCQLGSMWSESAWWVEKKDLWFYFLVPTYLGDPAAYICPGDPFGQQFDFDAETENGLYTDLSVPSCGYGMNYALRHFKCSVLLNPDRKPPKYMSRTILLAEVGPDDEQVRRGIHQKASTDTGLAWPWRDGGRLVWHDGNNGYYSGPSWLTGRHLGKINMSVMDGSVRAVYTADQLDTPPRTFDLECWGRNPENPYQYVCHLCRTMQRHYKFHKQNLWWWTGNPNE